MKLAKAFAAVFLVCFLATPALAEGPVSLVIGGNLKVGMPLEKAIQLLGIPKQVTINRGTEPLVDSIAIDYPMHGVVIHVMNKKTTVEEIEVGHTFKGSFDQGVKIGTSFNDLIAKYGMPESVREQIVRYPAKGIYFLLNKNNQTLVSAKVFVKGSKIFDARLLSQ